MTITRFAISPAKGRQACQLGIKVVTRSGQITGLTLHIIDALQPGRGGSIETPDLLEIMTSSQNRRNMPDTFYDAVRWMSGFMTEAGRPSLALHFPFTHGGHLKRDQITLQHKSFRPDRIIPEDVFEREALAETPYRRAVAELASVYAIFLREWGVLSSVTPQYPYAQCLQRCAAGLFAHFAADKIANRGAAALFSVHLQNNTAPIPTQHTPRSEMSAMWREASAPATVFITSGDYQGVQRGRHRAYCDRPLTYFDHWVNLRILSALCGKQQRPYTEDQIMQFAQSGNDVAIKPITQIPVQDAHVALQRQPA